MIAQGLFYSKLSYCLPFFTNTWDLDHYRIWDVRFTSFTKEDNRKFQVARLMVDKRKLQGRMNMPSKELLDLSGDLSVHQLGATVNLTKKILLTQKPHYLAQRLQGTQDRGTRTGITLTQENPSLGLARECFVYRGTKLFNLLPDDMKQESSMEQFKTASKAWVKQIIPVKP